MKKTLGYGIKSLQFAWKANGIYAVIEIASKIYDSTIYSFIQVFLLSKVIDLFSRGSVHSIGDLTYIIVSYLFASIVRLCLKSIADVKGAFLQEQLGAYIDRKIAEKLTELDPATFEKAEFQDLLAQLEGIKGSLQMHLIRFTSLLDATAKFVMAAIVVSATFPLFAPIVLVATIPSYLAWDKFRTVTWPFYVEKRSLVTRITEYVKTLLSSDSTSKESTIFKTGSTLLNKIKTAQNTYFDEFTTVNDPWMMRIFLVRIVQFSAFAYTQYLNLIKVISGALSVGQFALVFGQSLNLVFGAEEILNQYSSIAARNKYLDRFFDFFKTKKIVNSPSNPVSLPLQPTPPNIEFKSVSFTYPSSKRAILNNFNLKIRSGEKIALVGENGVGKSTIIKLLLRFYDVSEGEILVNGINVRDLDLNKWHACAGTLFQDFIKYQFTFKENVYLGDSTKQDNEFLLREAISRSGADKFLTDLPNNVNQIVGKLFENGVDLSGGQWQKLALARAFFRDAPILILDEPTSAIDAKAEYEIFQNVQNLQKDKTVIIISHRFSTVRHADRILVLDEGRIVEEGNHDTLMQKRGLYAELFEIQAQGYK